MAMIRRFSTVVALGVSVLAFASSASAATWHSNGVAAGTPFSLFGASSSINPGGGVLTPIRCTPSATGLLYGPSGTVGVNRAADLSLAFVTCRAGGFTASVSCGANSVSFWVNSYSSSAREAYGQLNASASSICTVTVPAISGCTLTLSPSGGWGSRVANATYRDVSGVLDIIDTGQFFTSTWSSCGTLWGSASGSSATTLTNAGGVDLQLSVSSAFVPNITI
jgi:hypothetical protein